VTERDDRAYDVVAFGATGFTGRLVARYLAATAPPPGLRWAIAGRNRDKLEALRAELLDIHKDCGDVGVLEADVGNPASLIDMAKQTRVVLSTVGPFARYGEPVVKACVDQGTDYVDITGEPAFVDMTIARYDDMARESGVRVVSCCGFDSIPHDLGVLFTLRQLPRDVPITVEGFVQAKGTFSGGTWTSAVEAFGGIREQVRGGASAGGYGDDGDPRRVRGIRPRVRYEHAVKGWVAPFPTIDPQVVLRSARTMGEYGPDFRYGHYVRVGTLGKLAAGAAAIGGVVALSQLAPTRELLLKVRQSGEGPSEGQRSRSWFRVTFVGVGGGKRVVTRVSGGDPGYDETAKMVSQAAMCLAQDALPERAGVLTPAAAMGEPLLERLQREGIRFEVLDQGSAG
jgi:short subunit dehydrogenase-like uncharacterized protein